MVSSAEKYTPIELGIDNKIGYAIHKFSSRSLSYVFVTTATAFLLMAFVYALVDAYHKWDGEPFIYAGIYSKMHFKLRPS